MKFSVLMSIYHKEKVEYFDRAMRSIWDEQTLRPAEIVLVEDGKLTNELYEIIETWKKKLGKTLKIIPLEKNSGLGPALNIGLKNCTYEIVARMDTDDISIPQRFEKQINIFKNSDVDVCSGWIDEFETDENKIVSYRKVPETHNEIIKFLKWRNGLNHPAVMYKKSAVKKAGDYKPMLWFEDYYLWARMALSGAKFYNIQEVLVHMRAGEGLLKRRKGLKYIIAEVKFFRELKNIGFLSTYEFLRNIFVRTCLRILPIQLFKKIYKNR